MYDGPGMGASSLIRSVKELASTTISKKEIVNMTTEEISSHMDETMKRVNNSMASMHKQMAVQMMAQQVGLASGSYTTTYTSKVNPHKKPPDPKYEFECFVSKGILIICLDTKELDILNLPLNEYIAIDTDTEGDLQIRWGEKRSYSYRTKTPSKELLVKIRKVMTDYYRKEKREFK